jgi:hypothetical protein
MSKSASPSDEVDASTHPSWVSRDGLVAAVSIFVMTVTTGVFIASLVVAFRAQSIPSFLSAIAASPWALMTLVDYVTGALVASLWICTRPVVLTALPNVLWALLLPASGNSLLYVYLILCLCRTRSLRSTLLASTRRHTNPSRSFLYAAGFSLAALSASYFTLLAYVWSAETLAAGYAALVDNPLVMATFRDNLMGIAIAAVILLARERPSRFSAWVWVCMLGLFGHGVFAIYALFVVRDALREDIHFGLAFACSKNPRHTLSSAYV